MQPMVVLTRDSRIADAVRAGCLSSGRPVAISSDFNELDKAVKELGASELVVDCGHTEAAETGPLFEVLTGERRVIGVVRDPIETALPGAQVVVVVSALQGALTELARLRAR